MAVTITWPTKVINVPRADMLLVQSSPTEIRELDIDAFRLELRQIEASEEGIPFLPTHSHVAPITVGGVTLARVVEIINGYTVTFEDGQYAVNLVGANSNIGDVTNVNQVSVRSANSAGLTYSKEIEDQSFSDARVWINIESGTTGTQFPRGTPGNPVNNLSDAQAIITNRGFGDRLQLHGTLILSSGQNLSGYDILGSSSINSAIYSQSGSDFTDTVMRNVALLGDVMGECSLEYGALIDVTNFEGSAGNSGLSGTITLAPTTASDALYSFNDCLSLVPGSSTPILDCNGADNLNVQFRRYAGGLEVRNFSGTNGNMSIDLTSGNVIIDSSCTDGTIVLRGVGTYTDNSSSGCTVIATGMTFGTSGLTPEESTQLASIDTLRKLFMNRMETNPTTGVMTIYDDDDTTVFLSGNIYEDVLAAQIYRGRGIERRDRLT